MSFSVSVLKGIENKTFNGLGLRIGIVYTQWNKEIVNSIVDAAIVELVSNGIQKEDVLLMSVPGAYEVPYGVRKMLINNTVDAIIAVGCLIKGETMHFERISEVVSQAIMRLNLDYHVPVIFGILTCLTEKQAKERASLVKYGKNSGVEWAQSAIQMAMLKSNSGLVSKL